MISVIIPIFNSEKYLKKCINSIVNQTVQDIEILLINDASTDDSLKICNYYQKIDSRIRLINLPTNGGQVQAYCKGLSICKGELVSFVDSDDWIEPTMLEELQNSLIKYDSDISACGSNHIYSSRFSVEPNNISELGERVFSSDEIKRNLYELHKLSNPIDTIIKLYRWNKLFKKELLLHNLKYLVPEIRVFEDNNLVIPCIIDAKRISYVNKPLYNYRRRENSTMSLLDKNVLISNRNFLKIQEKIYKDKKVPHLLNSDVFITTSYSIARILSSKNSYKEKKKMLNYVYSDIKKYHMIDVDYSSFSNAKKFVFVYKLVSRRCFFAAIFIGKLNDIKNKYKER